MSGEENAKHVSIDPRWRVLWMQDCAKTVVDRICRESLRLSRIGSFTRAT